MIERDENRKARVGDSISSCLRSVADSESKISCGCGGRENVWEPSFTCEREMSCSYTFGPQTEPRNPSRDHYVSIQT